MFRLTRGMKITVNSGNIGTRVALELARLGHQITLAVRTPKPNADWDRLGIRQVPFDINDVASMERALAGSEAFFSVTPLVQNLIEAGSRAILAAKRAGIRKIVRVSALGAGPGTPAQLPRWHYEVERMLETSRIPYTVLRPASFMQNYLRDGIPETIKNRNAFNSPLVDARVSLIDARDVSSVAARVLMETGHHGRHYELTGGESLSNEEIANFLSVALSRRINHIPITMVKTRENLLSRGKPVWEVDLLTELHAINKAGRSAIIKPDVETILGRKPYAFQKFVRDHLSAFGAPVTQPVIPAAIVAKYQLSSSQRRL